MPKALKVCPCIGCDAHPGSCPELVQSGRCQRCKAAADAKRGTSTQRGYGHQHRTNFRAEVLRRDVLCRWPGCWAPATEADHHPRDRRELEQLGLDPNDPRYGRGLCKPHHSMSTAAQQPGGWNSHRA